MLFPTFLLLASSVVSGKILERKSLGQYEGRSVEATVWAPPALKGARARSPSVLTPSHNTLTLTRQKSAKGYNPRSAAWLSKNKPSRLGPSNATTTLLSLFLGEEFATQITFGDFTFETIVDTGSSDTWVVETGFQCENVTTGAPLPEEACNFGPTYAPGPEFTQIPDENFNITYGDGEFLTGIMGYDQVTIAGITVKQEVALVNLAAWEGDDTTSGLAGFAYPALTSAYEGTDPHDDTTQEVYSPLFKTIYTDGLSAPLFSLAILRDISGPSGYLSLGGTPPGVNTTGRYVSTPILVTTITGYPATYDFYTITIDNTIVNHHRYPGGTYIVDSGTTLNYVPTPLAYTINNAFTPKAEYDDSQGAFFVDCNAKAPEVGINISGTIFYINPLDLILLAGTDENGNDVCITGVTDGGDDPTEDVYILGDTFQKNVVTVFDIGATELKFAANEFYASNDPYKRM